ncbi:MAG: DUF805 domain-containing protein [Alphaproteobacteria bacterium]|nr:DUF805 domain-containing protein [Alphaproteobacteria bacterium]
MSFGEAIASGFSNYVGFSGRAPRSEFWYWVLFVVILTIVAGIIDNAIIGMPIVGTIVSLGLLLPGIAVSVRRLHDIDRTGWWILISLVPLVGAILLLIWYCSKGTPGPNTYGSDPLPMH